MNSMNPMILRSFVVLAGLIAAVACSAERGPADGTSGTDAGATDGAADGSSAADTADVVVPKLFINEVVAKAAKGDPANPTGSDWLELYNDGAEEVDLTGCRILDSAKKPFDSGFTLPPGTKIGAKGFLVVFFNHDGAGTPVIDKGLAADEAATLWDSTGKMLDQVNWETGDAPQGNSWGRVPDGSKVFKTMTKPTPGAANEGA